MRRSAAAPSALSTAPFPCRTASSAPVVAGDLSIYPLAFTVVANDAMLRGLSERHRHALETAAGETAVWAASTRPSEASAARALCERSPGARVVTAGPTAVQEWVDATRGLAARLREPFRGCARGASSTSPLQ